MAMTKQYYFDKVVGHLRAQGKKCTLKGECRYKVHKRGSSEVLSQSANGCVIPGRLYNRRKMEGKTIREVLSNHPELESYFPSWELADRMQYIHDRLYPDQWERAFEATAKRFGLEYEQPWRRLSTV